MENLFKTRRTSHFLMLVKYWRLVFNDHFVIALFFMFGALGWGYSQSLGKLVPNSWWDAPLAIAVLVIGLQIGRLATLFEKPDPIFLLPQSKMIDHYLRQSLTYSSILGELIMLLISVATLPFIVLTNEYQTWQASIIVIAMLLLKLVWIEWELVKLYQTRTTKYNEALIKFIVPLIVLIVGFYMNWIVAIVLNFLFVVIMTLQLRRASHHLLNWRSAIAKEEQRMLGVYRFFNLFTDVPQVQGVVHRRVYLDWLVNIMSQPRRPFSYLYVRGIIRGTEVSGLIVRLTVVGMAILFFVPIFWLNLVIMILFVYLIAIQLIPFYWHFDTHVFSHLYPVNQSDKQKDFQSIINQILLIAMIFLLVASSGMNFNATNMIIKLIVGIVEVIVLSRIYLKYRINQKN